MSTAQEKLAELIEFYGPADTQIVRDLTEIADHLAPEIDWERKFQDQVTANSAKLAEVTAERDQARTEVDKLTRKVESMRSASAKVDELRQYNRDSEASWDRRCAELRVKNAELSRKVGRGQRETIESVIAWLQGSIAKLPE